MAWRPRPATANSPELRCFIAVLSSLIRAGSAGRRNPRRRRGCGPFSGSGRNWNSNGLGNREGPGARGRPDNALCRSGDREPGDGSPDAERQPENRTPATGQYPPAAANARGVRITSVSIATRCEHTRRVAPSCSGRIGLVPSRRRSALLSYLMCIMNMNHEKIATPQGCLWVARHTLDCDRLLRCDGLRPVAPQTPFRAINRELAAGVRRRLLRQSGCGE